MHDMVYVQVKSNQQFFPIKSGQLRQNLSHELLDALYCRRGYTAFPIDMAGKDLASWALPTTLSPVLLFFSSYPQCFLDKFSTRGWRSWRHMVPCRVQLDCSVEEGPRMSLYEVLLATQSHLFGNTIWTCLVPSKKSTDPINDKCQMACDILKLVDGNKLNFVLGYATRTLYFVKNCLNFVQVCWCYFLPYLLQEANKVTDWCLVVNLLYLEG